MQKIFLLVLLLFLQSCWALKYYEYDSARQKKIAIPNLPFTLPIGVSKAKKQVVPGIGFIESIKAYRKSRGTLPASILELMNFSAPSKISVNEMYSSGFKNLEVLFYSPDSTQIWFSHEPVYRQKVGQTDFGGTYIQGMFTFIYNDSSFQTITRYH